ncbi:MAG: outer membrane beta-barrel domain-containing protein [Deltaproteobacteria bacterium]|nr:outer membrane beta-barrel domain-containing protein [Deltaproteobacteria bacterium]
MGRATIARGLFAGALLTAPLLTVPWTAEAQPRRQPPPAEQPAQPAQPGGGDGMVFTEDVAAQPGGDVTGATGGTAGPAGSGATGDLLGVPGGEVAAARHAYSEDISAVQQIYALRNHRVEFTPSVNVALNDPYVAHTGFGLSASYWISNVLSVGLTGVFFQGLNVPSDVNYFVGRSTGLVVPINEYQLAAALNFSYVPLYGKFSMFSRYIFHWDMYLTAGVGIMRTRPIPAVDPEIRTFDYGTRIMFDAGVGLRVFLSRSVGITAELRNFIYPELLENTSIGPDSVGGNSRCATCRRNPNTWTSQNALTDNVMVSVGLTLFLPFSFTYRLPK